MNSNGQEHEIIDVEPTGALVPVRESMLAPWNSLTTPSSSMKPTLAGKRDRTLPSRASKHWG